MRCVGFRSLSERYTKRLDSRSVQCSYGSSSVQQEREIGSPVVVKNANEKPMSSNFKYMYEIMGKKAKCLNNMAQSLGHAILKKHSLTLTEGTLKSYLVGYFSKLMYKKRRKFEFSEKLEYFFRVTWLHMEE